MSNFANLNHGMHLGAPAFCTPAAGRRGFGPPSLLFSEHSERRLRLFFVRVFVDHSGAFFYRNFFRPKIGLHSRPAASTKKQQGTHRIQTHPRRRAKSRDLPGNLPRPPPTHTHTHNTHRANFPHPCTSPRNSPQVWGSTLSACGLGQIHQVPIGLENLRPCLNPAARNRDLMLRKIHEYALGRRPRPNTPEYWQIRGTTLPAFGLGQINQVPWGVS